jgi:AraC-like DNA-binding protein
MLLPPASTVLCGIPTVTWPAMLATRGPGGMTDVHAHHAMHLVVARHGPIAVRNESGQPFGEARGVLTAPDVPHALDARGREVLVVFIDPESAAGARIVATAGGSICLLADAEVEHLWHLVDDEAAAFESLSMWAPKALDFLTRDDSQPRSVHPRVRAALKQLETLPPGTEPSLNELAQLAGLSPSRFTHAFVESVGVPFRTYLLWRKLQHAVIGIAAGHPLAKAALDAGFSDAAHMSRTFRRMFGTTPSELRRHSERPAPTVTGSTP